MRFCHASLVTRELLSPVLATRSQRPEASPAPPRLRLSFPGFSSALTLPEVNITAASREWVGVRVQLDGEFAACICVCVCVYFLQPFCRGPSLSSYISSVSLGLSLPGISKCLLSYIHPVSDWKSTQDAASCVWGHMHIWNPAMLPQNLSLNVTKSADKHTSLSEAKTIRPLGSMSSGEARYVLTHYITLGGGSVVAGLNGQARLQFVQPVLHCSCASLGRAV